MASYPIRKDWFGWGAAPAAPVVAPPSEPVVAPDPPAPAPPPAPRRAVKKKAN